MQKKLYLIVELFITILLLSLAGLLFVPAYRSAVQKITVAKNRCVTMIQDKTGLIVSCGSVSPSILKRAGLHDVVITDSYTGIQLCSVKKIYAYYNPSDFLSDMPWKAITRIVIEDGDIAFDHSQHQLLLEKLRSLAANDNNEDEDRSLGVSALNDVLEVAIRNVKIAYSNADFSTSALLRKTRLQIVNNSILIDVFSDVSVSGIPVVNTYQSLVHLSGSIAADLSDGTIELGFSDNRLPNMTLADFSFLLTLAGTTIDVRSSRSVTPVDFHLSADFAREDISVSLTSENLKPFSFIHSDRPFPSAVADSLLSGKLTAFADSRGNIAYDCDMSASFPGLYRQGEEAVFSCVFNGTQEKIEVAKLGVFSDSLRANFTGLFLYESPDSGTARSRSLFPFLPEGRLTISRLICPNGLAGNASFYLNAYRNGFMIFSPGAKIGDALFSDVELVVEPTSENIDLAFTCKNYGAEAGGLDGTITADGSITLGSNPYAQIFVGIDTLMLDPVYRFVSAFTQNSSSVGPSPVSDFAVTTELYVATDFTHLSFNSPRFVLAGLDADDLYALFSVAGSDRSIDFSDITVAFGSNTLQGDVHAEIDTDDSFLFNSNLVLNSVPYGFSGMLASSGDFNVYGDYGFSLIGTALPDFSKIDGQILCSDLPIILSGFTLSTGLEMSFAYRSGGNSRLVLNSLSVAEVSGRMPSMPQITASGVFDQNGLFIDKLALTDTFSTLRGMCSVNWNLHDENRFIETMMTLEDELSSETVQLSGVLSNASQSAFFSPDDMILSFQSTVQNFFAGHFLPNQHADSRISLTASASGTVNNNYLNIDSPSFSFILGEIPVSGHVTMSAADNILQLQNSAISLGAHSFSGINASYALQDAIAELSTEYSGVLLGNGITTTANMNISGISGSSDTVFSAISDLASNFSADVQLSHNTINGDPSTMSSIDLLVVKLPDQVLLTAGEDAWLQGMASLDGRISVIAKAPFPAEFTLDGNLNPDEFSIAVSDAVLDFPKIWNFLNMPAVVFNTGIVTGNFSIGGAIQDPEFSGELTGTEMSLQIPDFVAGQTKPFLAQISAHENHILVDANDIGYGTGRVLCGVDIAFDRWNLADVAINVRTLEDTQLPADLEVFMAHIKGNASGDLTMRVNGDRFYLGGSLLFEDGFVCLSNDFSSLDSDDSDFKFMSDFSVAIGSHVEFLFPSERMPILRSNIAAAEPVSILVDGERQTFSVTGTADMRGGQIFYVKRNFYLRDGTIEINANQNLFDPLVSFHAEIRERDTENKPVSIILSARRQFLSQMAPVLTSSPPKSEVEIRTLLGHAAFVDAVTGGTSENVSVKEVALSVSDVFTQFLFFRQFENFMRETLHLDSFSIRSQLLQNVINTASSDNSDMRLGNYFDNTSVYVGKYLVSDLYLDGMFHLYYDKMSAPTDPWGGLRFQLESGFEIASPFCNIRFNYRPEFDKWSETLGIPDASVTLSWKFDF